jgi:hypothetical protein
LPAHRQNGLRSKQVKPERVGQGLLQPGRLAGAPRTEKEERAIRQRKKPWNHRQQISGKSAGGLCKSASACRQVGGTPLRQPCVSGSLVKSQNHQSLPRCCQVELIGKMIAGKMILASNDLARNHFA